MAQDLNRKDLIENDLSYALERQQFHLAYQPQYHVHDKRITGVEALIRWTHPELGEMHPWEFIHVAEEKGILKKLFLWTLEEVCKEINTSENQYIFSINMSVNQLISEEILLDIRKILNKHQVSESRLVFEITEEKKLYTESEAGKNLQSLYDAGYKIAMDDFGNGYFSFADFIHLPLHHVKLDRNFVESLKSDPKVERIATTIISMAKELGLKVVIEGVETHAQYVKWRQMGCDIIQGYYVGRPVRFKELNKLVKRVEKDLSLKTKDSLAHSVKERDREFDEEMRQYDKELERLKNNIIGEEK